MAKYCIHCGAKLNEDSRFCLSCGARVAVIQEPEKAVEIKPAPQKKTVPRQEQAVKPKPAAEKSPVQKKKAGSFPFVLLLVFLAAGIAFAGFVYPGFLREKEPELPYAYHPGTPAATPKPTEPSIMLEVEDLPELTGNSSAFSYDAAVGVHVSAQENAFSHDTTVIFTEQEDFPQQLAGLEDEFAEMEVYPLKIWEVDAGLEGNEVMPGTFEVELDLKALGIDEELYPGLGVYRVDDEGYYYEFSTKLDGDMLSFSSSQNSWEYLMFKCSPPLYGLQKTVDTVNRVSYFYSKREFLFKRVQSKTIKTPSGSYEIQWINDDIDPELGEKSKRVIEIEQECKKQAEEFVKTLGAANSLEKNLTMVRYYQQLLAGSEEYLRLQQDLKMPEPIRYSIQCINTAYEYLGKVAKVRMPTQKVLFIVRTDSSGKLGEAGKLNYSSMVSLWPFKGGYTQETKDNYLLTITHELFHICQERYRITLPVLDSLVDDVRFDEMVTMVLERDAKEYYKEKGVITTDPPLTELEYWETLRLPINSEPTGLSALENHNMRMYEGYHLGSFVMYLQTQYPDKNITPHLLMKSRRIDARTSISAAIRKAFGMEEDVFDSCFRKWLVSVRKTLEAKDDSIFQGMTYGRKEMIRVVYGEKYHVDLQEDDSYFLAMSKFMRDPKRTEQGVSLKGIIVPDKDFTRNHPSVQLMPLEKYTDLNQGVFIDNFNMFIMAEIYGKLTPGENMKVGYTLYSLAKPASVGLAEEGSDIIVQLPENSMAAADGLIDGYLMKVIAGGQTLEYSVAKENLEKRISLPKENFFVNQDPGQSLAVKVTITEFVKDKKGELHYGFESDPETITVNSSQMNQNEYKGFKVSYDSLCRFSADEFAGNDLTGQNWTWTRDEMPGGNTITIAGDKITIQLAELDWNAYGAAGEQNWSNAARSREKVVITGLRDRLSYDPETTFAVTGANETISGETNRSSQAMIPVMKKR